MDVWPCLGTINRRGLCPFSVRIPRYTDTAAQSQRRVSAIWRSVGLQLRREVCTFVTGGMNLSEDGLCTCVRYIH